MLLLAVSPIAVISIQMVHISKIFRVSNHLFSMFQARGGGQPNAYIYALEGRGNRLTKVRTQHRWGELIKSIIFCLH